MTKELKTEAEAIVAETASGSNADWLPPADLMTSAMSALRGLELDPIKIWAVKGAKGVGGLVLGVFCQATNEVVLVDQRPSGRFTVFRKASVNELSANLDV